MQIVERIVTPQDGESPENTENRSKWESEFCKKGGISHIYHALLNLPLSSIQHPLSRSCFQLILKLLCMIQPKENSVDPAGKAKIIEKIFFLLEAFAHYSIPPEGSIVPKCHRKSKAPTAKKDEEEAKKNAETEVESQELQRQKKKQLEESKAFEQGLKLAYLNSADPQDYFQKMINFPKFTDLLLKCLIQSDNPFMQAVLGKELTTICKHAKTSKFLPSAHPHMVLVPLMLQPLLKETLKTDGKCNIFFDELSEIVSSMSKAELIEIPINYLEILESLSNFLKNREIKEIKSTDTDDVLVGLLKILEVLLSKFSKHREIIGQKCGIVSELLHKCLFEFPKGGKSEIFGKPLPPKCKSQQSRRCAFAVLGTLACDTPVNLKEIISYILPIHV